MKKASVLRICGLSLIALLFYGFSGWGSHTRDTSDSISHGVPTLTKARVVTISSSGQRLNSFFEGLAHLPSNSLETIVAKNHELRECRRLRTKQSPLAQLLEMPTVYASHGCFPPFPCGGSYWTQFQDACDFNGCGGSFLNTTYDYELGSWCAGYFFDGGHCGPICECGWQSVICWQC